MKLLVVLLASPQRGRRESPSRSAVCPFTVFLGYVKIPTQINSRCCKMLYHRGSLNLASGGHPAVPSQPTKGQRPTL